MAVERSGMEVAIDVQLNIMSFLSPQDLCHLGSTSCYWKVAVKDLLLWRYFLLWDLPFWTSVDWKSLPDVEIFNKAFSGIGSGVSFQFNNNQKFSILTLYSTTSMERRRARAEQAVVNKMFYKENSIVGNQQSVHYNVIAQDKKVCKVVDELIYVANAEAHKSKGPYHACIGTSCSSPDNERCHCSGCSDSEYCCYSNSSRNGTGCSGDQEAEK
ncbi:LOW QUALITY PROTEIN: F-box only protein 4-like [Numenius arquata]|uniref:LOW QUALITY PROTEIN: F-box only protein 4-like n=1 Tax=Numenius arquata TaxID=31919 RepID=UPI003D307410